MKNNELTNILGARNSKDNKRVNITLVAGEGETRTYATVSLAKDKEDGAAVVKVMKDNKTGEEFAFVKIKMLKPFEKKEETKEEAKAKVKENAEKTFQTEMPF